MISAILLTYYKERIEIVKENLMALEKGTLKPDRIIIANNNTEIKLDQIKCTNIINSNLNIGTRLRMITALSVVSDYYYFIDDDCVVREKTLENLYKNRIDGVVGYCGKTAENGNYRTPLIYGNRIKNEVETNIIIGVGSMLASYNALINMFKLEAIYREHPDYNNGREDDLLLSIPNKSKVIPADKDSMINIKGSQKVGLYKQENHVLGRIKVTKSAYETWDSYNQL
jgi:hypothetical protein